MPDVAPREDAGPDPTSGYDGGVGLGLADIADTPCAPRGGSVKTVLQASDASARPIFRSLDVVGQRRLADLASGTGFVVFDADGTNAKLVTTKRRGGGTTVLGEQILFGAGVDSDSASIEAYDANGVMVGGEVPLALEPPPSLTLGADDQAALGVWTTRSTVRARGFAKGAAAGMAPYDLAVDVNTQTPSSAVSSVKSGLFAVVFSGSLGPRHQTIFGRGSTTARVGDPTNLFTGSVARTVVGLARTPSGFVLLVTVHDSANPYAMLVFTDLGGRRTSAGLKLVGTLEASALAVKGSEVGVLAQRREGTAFEYTVGPEFRAFDLAGAPLGPWVCLEPPTSSAGRGGGLVAESNGYAALVGAADGSTSLARFDRLGAGMP